MQNTHYFNNAMNNLSVVAKATEKQCHCHPQNIADKIYTLVFDLKSL